MSVKNFFIGVFCIFAYLLIALLMMLLQKKPLLANGAVGKQKAERQRLFEKIIFVLFFSLLFVLLNYLCTKMSGTYGYDRTNYQYEFDGVRAPSSVGLDYVFRLIRLNSNNFLHVLLFTTFASCVLVLIGNFACKDHSKYSLIFLLTTDFVFFSFTALKQSFACGLVGICFALLLNGKKSKIETLFCLLLIGLATLFHVTAIIALPVFLLIKFKGDKKISICLYALLLFVFVLFFERIGTALADFSRPFFPSLSNMLTRYFSNSESADSGSTIIVFIKGFPYYYLVFLGFFNRSRFKKIIKNYDAYLVLILTGAVLYFCSAFIYWVARFRAYFYLPAALFFGILMSKSPLKDKSIHSLVILGSNAFILIRWLLLIFINSGGF